MTTYTSTDFLSDIPMSAAVQAHNGTSFVPEKRGEGEKASYAEFMATFFNRVLKVAGEERKDEALAELSSFRERYRDRQISLLRRRGGLMSTMVTGPSNFPVRRQQKKSDAYHNALTEHIEWTRRVTEKILRKFADKEAVRTGDAEAVDQLKKKIAKAEAWQQFMKDANKIIRNDKLTEDEKVDLLIDLDDDLTEVTIRKLINDKPYARAQPGFEAYQLSNNNANIRRMKEQLAKAEKLASQVTTETVIGAVRIVNNVEDDRLELYFPTRTSKELYANLKSHGFRYTPSKSVPSGEGCFQAFRGANADYWAPLLAKQYNDEQA